MGISLNGVLICINGPFACGAYPEVKIFRSAMKMALLSGERVTADKGYGDIKCASPNLLTADGRCKAAEIRARHETYNGRLKSWRVLSNTFRHNVSKHGLCFYAVANIVQLELDSKPLFLIEY